MKKLLLTLLAFILLTLASCAAAGGPTLAFSEPPGFYQSRFSLGVTCSDSRLTLRYTTDSSVPTADSNEYVAEDGIAINYRGGGGKDPSSVNIIRVAAFDSDGNRVGETLTGTYILTDVPEVRYSTMIVSIVCEPDDLYGYERGILTTGKIRDDFNKNPPAYWTNKDLKDANFFRSGIEWERPAHVEFYSQSGELLTAQSLGIRVSGGWNRNNNHKSLRLFARYVYDDSNVIDLDAYPGLVSTTGIPVSQHKTLILRTGSNNFWSSTIQTQLLMQLAEPTGLDIMHYRPVCVYLNGKYYGYMALIEDYSTTYFETHYNIPSEYVTCINGAGYIDGRTREWQLDNGPTSEKAAYNRMMQYIISLDMSKEQYYARACEMLDIDSFIKYMCYQGFIGNSDWPQNNVRVWRYNGGVGADGYDEQGYDPDNPEYGFDGRWRYLLKDLDLSAGYGSGVSESMFARLTYDDGHLRLGAMFKSLFDNHDFRSRCYAFICDMLSSYMTPERVLSVVGEVEAAALTEMRYYAPSYGASGGSNKSWHEHLRTPLNFLLKRHENVKKELVKKYDSVYGTLKVEIEGEGRLSVNTLELTECASLEYLVGLQIPLSAQADEGWRLASLEVGGRTHTSGESFMMSARSLTVRAVFEPDPDYGTVSRGLIFNELKYNHARNSGEPDMIELYNDSSEPLYLKGWSLEKRGLRADGSPDTDEWFFPAEVIAPGEYVTIACDRAGTSQWVSGMHTSFGIGVGDVLTLRDRSGSAIDSLTLARCNNFAVWAREGDEWYFEPYATFGAPNVRDSGYRLSSVLDPRAFDTFIHEGRFCDDLASLEGGRLVILPRRVKEFFGADSLSLVEARFGSRDSYLLEDVLELLGYRLGEVSSLHSWVIFRK